MSENKPNNPHPILDPQELVGRDRSLRAALYDGMAHSVMLGAGESYLNAFAIFLKGSALQIGLLISLPPLIGTWLQVLCISASERFRSRRKLLLWGISTQALLWLPMALIPFLLASATAQVWTLLALVTFYYITAHLTTPAWSSLIGDLVPIEARGGYFGYRNRLSGMWAFVALLAAGQILSFSEQRGQAAYGFAAIFGIALLARVLSIYFLARYEDPPYQVSPAQRFSFWQFISRAPHSNFAKFVIFFSAMNFAIFIAGPYYAMYMLNDLKMSYAQFTAVTAISTMTQFLTMHYWGRLADQFGNKKILTICGAGIALIPFPWLITSNFWAILLMQTYAGVVAAGFNLASANFIFDAVTPPKRARCVAYQSAVNALFVVAGTLLGSAVATHVDTNWPIEQSLALPDSQYMWVFFLSGVLRLAVLLAFVPLFREVRDVQPISHRELIFRIAHLRPLSGITFALITSRFKRPSRTGKSRRRMH